MSARKRGSMISYVPMATPIFRRASQSPPRRPSDFALALHMRQLAREEFAVHADEGRSLRCTRMAQMPAPDRRLAGAEARHLVQPGPDPLDQPDKKGARQFGIDHRELKFEYRAGIEHGLR